MRAATNQRAIATALSLSLSLSLSLAAAATLVACTTTSREPLRPQIEPGNERDGLARLEQAQREQPRDAQARMQYVQALDQVNARLTSAAAAELAAGRYDAAAALYAQVLEIQPGHQRAREGMTAVDTARRHATLAADARERLTAKQTLAAELMVQSILVENADHPAARELQRELRELERKAELAVPALQSKLQEPVTLEFRDAPVKLVMEALARSAGINFILDREIRNDLKASIFVRNVRVEDALDLIIQNHQLEKKVLTPNTILIYPSTPQKLREHQELVMRSFQLGNADPKQTLNLLRTMLKTKDLFVDERTNLLVMRDTPEAVRAAEKLISAQDKADPEVELELEILEVSRSKAREIGITYPTTFSGPSGTLASIAKLNRGTIGVDTGFALKLLRTDGDTRTLANPRVRVRNREKARIHVGDRVPVISSTIVGTTAGGVAGGTPVTTEQIQYLDVGIKIEVEPTIHADESVAVRVNLDVSSLGAQIKTNAGTTAYEVGTRNATTVLRLRDGETQALMGLIRDDDVQAGSGLPFASEAPVLEHVLGSKRTERRSRELVLLITPRLVRGIERTDATISEFWSGTEATVRTRSPFVQPLDGKVARDGAAVTTRPIAAADGGASGATPVVPTAPGDATTTVPAATTAPVAATTPATLAARADAQAPAATGAAPQTAQPLKLSWKSPPSLEPGKEFVVTLVANSATPVRGATVQIGYDAESLEVLGIDEGTFFAEVGGAAVFTPRIDAAQGVVFATMGASGDGSAKGNASLFELRVRARKPQATLRIASIVGVDAANRRVSIDSLAPLELGARR